MAAKISEALDAPKLAVISFPNSGLAEDWGGVLLPTLREHLRIKEDVEEAVEITISRSDSDPLAQLAVALGQTLSKMDDFLYVPYGDPAVFIIWPEGEDISGSWQTFLGDLVSRIRQIDQSRFIRKVVLLNGGNQAFPDFLTQSVSVDHFQLWNALTWEELRLFTSSRIADERNDIRRAWMVSTYCGAANFDLKALLALIQARPLSLVETVAKVMTVVSRSVGGVGEPVAVSGKNFGREWHPPASLADAWHSGAVIAASIERGLTRPWASHEVATRENAAYHLIWKEQVSGLFPLLIELGQELNEIVLRMGGAELNHLRDARLDPAEMLDVIRESKLRVPQNLYDALRDLRKARNQLAHLEPVDRRDLEAIWDVQLRVRAGQYK